MLSKITISVQGILLLLIILGCERTVTIPQPDEPPPRGYVFINTYPKGMQIFMDGKDRRRLTPDSITWLESKEYEFTLKHPFFLDTSFKALANENQRESLFIDYRLSNKMLATLEMDSYPKGANIYLNDSLIGHKTPYILKNKLPGYYKVKYKLENHRDTEHTVLLTSSKITRSFLPMLDITLWQDYNYNNSGLYSNKLTCITKDKYENIIIGSEDWGIYTFDGTSFKNYNVGNSAVANNTINDVSFMQNNTMLVATAGMAIIAWQEQNFGTNEQRLWEFWQVGDSVITIPDNFITSVAIEPNGRFWFGTKKGLVSSVYDAEFSVYYQEIYTAENSPLLENYITDLEVFNDKLWIGTKSSGFVIASFQGDDLDWQIFTKSNSGLLSNNVNSVLPLGSQEGYIGTATGNNYAPGLAYFNNNSLFTEYFNMPDNNVHSLYKDTQGRIWIGTETSIIVFSNWEDRKVYTYQNSALPIEKISGFLEDRNGNILITSQGGGLFKYFK